jgi:hypothetical protein
VLFSKAGSADKRKADSIFRISEFDDDYTAIDALLRTAMHIAKNLDSVQDLLSRRITIVNLQLKMHDLGRHSVPDHDFGGASLEGDAFDAVSETIGTPVENDKKDEESNKVETEELSF